MLHRFLSAALLACVVFPVNSAVADPNAGSYLAARQANVANDFSSSAHYYTKSLLSDPTNAELLEKAMTSFMALGQLERAIPVAQAMVEKGYHSQMAHLALSAKAAKDGAWSDIFTALEQGRSVAPLVDGLSQAWAHLGEGDIKKSLDSFDQLIETEGTAIYGVTHKAYALGLVGDFEGAEAVYLEAAAKGQLRYSANSAMAHAQILSQLDRNDDAIAVLDSVFGAQRGPKVEGLYQALRAGQNVPFDTVSSASDGLADIFFSVANAVKGETPDSYTLLYTQTASYLDPDNSSAVILTAELLDNLEQFDLANDAYASVSRDDPAFHAAELGRAQALFAAGREEASIEVLNALSRSHPDIPQVYATKGDTLRRAGRYADATPAYSRAIELYTNENPVKWFVHYTRGITYHKTDNWPAAEADFRAALNMRPDQPQVLNYLGYSLVERGEKLGEALGMIEKAAAAQPENGAIIDSLGWVLFQLGRYEESVGYMERAAALMPVDPVINDHLGDVYWAVGRETEAEFQWHRALSFDPSQEDADRIRDKLSRGLDLVMHDEGLDPVRMASGND